MTAPSSPRLDTPFQPPAETSVERLTELLLAAVPEDLARFESLCAHVQNWGGLFDYARSQGVAGVLWHHLAHPDVSVSPRLKRRAERYLGLERLAQTRLRAALDEALHALAHAGVRAVPLKGLVLGDRLYPTPSLRPSLDNDLLVAPADLDRAAAALEVLGYLGETELLQQWSRKNHHHLFFSRAQTPPLEVHFRASSGFGTHLPSDDLLARAVPYRLTTGTATWVLSPEDEAIYLAVHAAVHLFEALHWLYDLKLLLRRESNLDWSLVAARARAWGVLGPVAACLDALRGRLAVQVPPGCGLVPPHPQLVATAKAILAVTARQPRLSWRAKLGTMLFRTLAADRPGASSREFAAAALRVTRRRAYRYFPWAVPEAWSQ